MCHRAATLDVHTLNALALANDGAVSWHTALSSKAKGSAHAVAKKRLSVLLMGAGGNMRHAHLPRILDDGAVDIAAVADPVREQARLLMEKASLDIPYYRNWRTMLEETDADGALVSTPHRDHYAQAKACLERGLHTLVEKPLVIRPQHAKELLALAAERRLALVVAYQRHWMPHFVHARELVRQGALGELRGVVAYVTQHWTGAGGWRLDPAASGGGMFMDTGSHLVASLLWVSGLTPRTVAATFDNAGLAVDVNGGVLAQFDGGVLGTLTTTGNASLHDERLALSGSGGSLVLHLHQWQVRSMLLNDRPLEPPKRSAPNTPDAALFRWMRNGLNDYEAQDFALQVSRLTQAAYRSAAEGKPVEMRG